MLSASPAHSHDRPIRAANDLLGHAVVQYSLQADACLSSEHNHTGMQFGSRIQDGDYRIAAYDAPLGLDGLRDRQAIDSLDGGSPRQQRFPIVRDYRRCQHVENR